MTEAEVFQFNNASVAATHIDGRIFVGHLHETPLPGLYTIQPNPTVYGVIQGGFVEAIRAEHFAKIEACRP